MAPKAARTNAKRESRKKTPRANAPSATSRKPARTKATRVVATAKHAGAKKTAVRKARRVPSETPDVVTKIVRQYLSPHGRSEVGVQVIRLAVRTARRQAGVDKFDKTI